MGEWGGTVEQSWGQVIANALFVIHANPNNVKASHQRRRQGQRSAPWLGYSSAEALVLSPQWPCRDLISVSVICPTFLSFTKRYAGKSRAARLPARLRSWPRQNGNHWERRPDGAQRFCYTFVWLTKTPARLCTFSCSTTLFRERNFNPTSLFAKIIKFSKDPGRCNT